ncbi:MAG: hypothetical protein U0401_24185 [Anaerolineae bacterium]
MPLALVFGAGNARDNPLALPLLHQACAQQPTLHRLHAITKNPRRATDPTAGLATDAYSALRPGTPWYQALFYCRTCVERANSWAKLTFNLKYHKYRG